MNIECHEHRVVNFIFSCIRKLKNYDKETSILIFILKNKLIRVGGGGGVYALSDIAIWFDIIALKGRSVLGKMNFFR